MRHIGVQTVFYTEIRVERRAEIHLAIFKCGIFADIQILDSKHVYVVKGFNVLGEAFEVDEFFKKMINAVDCAARCFARDHDIFASRADDEAVVGECADVGFQTTHLRTDMDFGASSGTALYVGITGNDGTGRFVKVLIQHGGGVHFRAVRDAVCDDMIKAFSVFCDDSSHNT